MDDISIVLPIYNENHDTVRDIKRKLTDLGAEVIVVDDGSDIPYQDALKHGVNFGYGGAILTGIKNSTRDLILVMDGDGQHTTEDALKLYTAWKLIGNIDMLVGVRRIKNEIFHRLLGRKILNFIASLFATIWLPDLNSGMRVFRKDLVMGYAPILCKGFSFTTSLTMSMMCDNYRVEWFPINVQHRTYGKSKVKVIKHGFVTLYYIVRIGFALRTRKLREWLRNLRGKK